MSTADDPFGPADKTVIRPSLAAAKKPDPPANPVRLAIAPAGNVTVFDPGALKNAAPVGWSSGTVVFAGKMASDTGDRSADATPPPRSNSVTAIGQDELLAASGQARYDTENPLLAAAAPLLTLFGRLRVTTVERQPEALARHISDAIQLFETRVAAGETREEDARIAKFVLCEAADDIVANLPGVGNENWKAYSLVRRFFRTDFTGSGTFDALNKVLAHPEAHYDLIELIHSCLSLGFEGQYRRVPREGNPFERVRQDVYDTLRFFKARPDDDLSPHWRGLAAVMAKPPVRLPLWAAATAMVAMVTAAFFGMRIAITDDGDAVADELLALNPSTPVVIERASFVPKAEEAKPAEAVTPPPVVEAPPKVTQLDRVSAALAVDIKYGVLTVGTKGEYIVVEIGNAQLFQSGKAVAKPEFEPVAGRIAAALQPEKGPVKIVGHTDNVKPKKSNTFKSNYDLSIARAKAVEKIIAPKFGDASRIVVEGKGEDEPIADNATPDGRTKNRRVDIMVKREETL